MILIGLGTGVHRTVFIDQLSWRYPDRIGRLLGLFDTAGTLGGVAASLVVVLATGSREWRLLFLAAAVTGLGFIGTTIARISHHSATVSGTDFPRCARAPAVPLRVQRPSVCPVRWGDAVFRLRLQRHRGVSFAVSHRTWLHERDCLTALQRVVRCKRRTGRHGCASRIGSTGYHPRPLLLALAAGGLTGTVVFGSAGPLVLGTLVVVFGLGGHGFRPIRGAHLSTALPDEVTGGGLELVRTLLMSVSTLAPAVVGFVADLADFHPRVRSPCRCGHRGGAPRRAGYPGGRSFLILSDSST